MTMTAEVPVTTSPNRRQRRQYQSAKREKLDLETEVVIDDEVFIAHPGRVPGAIMIDLMRVGVHQDSEAMWDVFRCAFDTEPPRDDAGKPTGPSEFERFRDYLRSPDHPVEANTLRQIIEDMSEDSSGFPTTPSRP